MQILPGYHCGSVRGALWRIISKYILFFLRMFQSFYRRFSQNTTHHVMGIRADPTNHDMRPVDAVRLRPYIMQSQIVH